MPDAGPATPQPPAVPAGAEPPLAERPELYVGAAFAGGFVIAMLLRRLARG